MRFVRRMKTGKRFNPRNFGCLSPAQESVLRFLGNTRDWRTPYEVAVRTVLVNAVWQCDRKFAVKDLPAEVWLAVTKARVEYLGQMARLIQDLGEIAKGSASGGGDF